MKTFTRKVIHPVTEEIVLCEVHYKVEDVGTGPSKFRPVVKHVLAGDKDILPLLGTSEVHEMEDEAETHDADARALNRFGPEAI